MFCLPLVKTLYWENDENIYNFDKKYMKILLGQTSWNILEKGFEEFDEIELSKNMFILLIDNDMQIVIIYVFMFLLLMYRGYTFSWTLDE